MLKSASGMQMFGDIVRRKRYFYALLMKGKLSFRKWQP